MIKAGEISAGISAGFPLIIKIIGWINSGIKAVRHETVRLKFIDLKTKLKTNEA